MATEWAPKPRQTSSHSGPGRTHFTWGCGGLLLGVLLTALVLVAFAPHPKTVTVAPAPTADLTVTLDDQYLARLVVQGIKAANIPAFTVTNVKAHIAPQNLLTFSGSVATFPGVALADLSAQGQLGASGGLLVASNISGDLGGLTLPAVVDNALEVGINIAITNQRQRLSQGGIQYYIEGVSSSDGLLTLTLTFS